MTFCCVDGDRECRGPRGTLSLAVTETSGGFSEWITSSLNLEESREEPQDLREHKVCENFVGLEN